MLETIIKQCLLIMLYLTKDLQGLCILRKNAAKQNDCFSNVHWFF